MQFSTPFNARSVQPASVDGGGGHLPVGEHPVVISASEMTPTKDNTGQMLVLTIEAIDGPAKGQSMKYRLNVFNQNAQASQIAQRQLSAICYVTGVFDVNDSVQLHGKPFIAVIISQNVADHPEYSQVKGVKNMQGLDPGASGSNGATPPAAQPPAAAPAPAAAGWGAPAAAAPAAAPAAAAWAPQAGAAAAPPAGGAPWANR